MASILDNFTFAKLIQNFVISAIAKAVPNMGSSYLVGTNTQLDRSFFQGGGIIPIVMTTSGRNTDSQTDNLRLPANTNTIFFPTSYNWMMCSITGSYWGDSLNQIKNVVGSDAALNLSMNIIRVYDDGTETAIDSLQWTVGAYEAPFKRLPVCINRGQGVPSGSGLKFRINADLYPDRNNQSVKYSDATIFTQFPTLTSVGSIRHFDVLLWCGVRFDLINIDQEGG